jgi:uncharacterized protein YdcH (DUF465 family)
MSTPFPNNSTKVDGSLSDTERNIQDKDGIAVRGSAWPEDADIILENIRCNCIILSDYHKKQYFLLLSLLKYFRIPIIIISAFASVLNIGLQPFLEQQYISIICCMLSLVTGLIGSIELFLQVQKKMENELMNSRDFYLTAIDIYKVLSLEPEHRNGDGLKYLDGKFAVYCKMIENSNVLDKSIQDQLAPIDVVVIERLSSGAGSRNSETDAKEHKPNRATHPSHTSAIPSSSTFTGGFLSYFFGKSEVNHTTRRRHHSHLPSPAATEVNDMSAELSPQKHLDDQDDDDSVSSEERFDIYCKLLNKHNDIDESIMEKLTPILSNHSSHLATVPLEERVKLYSYLQDHVKIMGSNEMLDKLKIILVGDFFKKSSNMPTTVMKQHRFAIYKSLIDRQVDNSTVQKVKSLLTSDSIDQETLTLLLSAATHDISAPVADLESGPPDDAYLLGDEHPIGELTPLNRTGNGSTQFVMEIGPLSGSEATK